jgi:hypothetical protein
LPAPSSAPAKTGGHGGFSTVSGHFCRCAAPGKEKRNPALAAGLRLTWLSFLFSRSFEKIASSSFNHKPAAIVRGQKPYFSRRPVLSPRRAPPAGNRRHAVELFK